MSAKFHTIPVVEFFIGSEDEEIKRAANPQDFEETSALLNQLRSENPDTEYYMFAEIDA